MEQILALYAQPYDPSYPVVCFDERPCFLIGDQLAPLTMQPGKVARHHYSYTKHGSCALLAAIEPLTGHRIAEVYERRTRKEYTDFMQHISAAYPDAVQIRLVQDNLNTHTPASFYHCLPAADAFALANRFDFRHTPRSASWLNIIEIEFSALARYCLHRRIPSQSQLRSEVLALVRQRDAQRIKINWQFSLTAARSKLNRHYVKVNAGNAQCNAI